MVVVNSRGGMLWGVTCLVGGLAALAGPAFGQATGPIAHWRFDSITGATVADETGNFPGTRFGGATQGPGIAGGALELVRATGSYVEIGDVLPLTGAAKFTISMWVRLPAFTSPEQVLISRHVAGIVAGWFVATNGSGGSYGAPGKAWFYASHAPGPEPISTTSVNDNAWHHLVITRDPSTIRVYVDGAPAESSKTPVGIGGTSAPLLIGGIVVSGTKVGYTDGLLDDVQIYNRVLSDTQINALFAAPGETVASRCIADITHGAVAGGAGYGKPNCVLDNDDFFYYLAQFAAGNLAVADLTAGAVPGQPGFGVPNGVLNNDDFFYYLGQFAAGC